MPNFMKDTIKQSFIKLMNEKPISKITVKDIVVDCKINRNSFYYHYEDLPALVMELIIEVSNKIINMYTVFESIEECLKFLTSYLVKNKKQMLNIYNSTNREVYEKYLWKVCDHVISSYFKSKYDENTPDLDILIHHYKCSCFGLIIDWMNSSMSYDLCDRYSKLIKIKKNIEI